VLYLLVGSRPWPYSQRPCSCPTLWDVPPPWPTSRQQRLRHQTPPQPLAASIPSGATPAAGRRACLSPPLQPLAGAPAGRHVRHRHHPWPPVAARPPFWRRRLSPPPRLAAAPAAGRRSRRRPPPPLPARAPAPPPLPAGVPVLCRRPGHLPPVPPLAASPADCRCPRRWRRPCRRSVVATTPSRVRPAGGRAVGDEWWVAVVGVGERRRSRVGGARSAGGWP